MSIYRVQLVCERGTEPTNGETLDREEETIEVEASEPWDAYRKATLRMTISPRGRLLTGYDADTGEPIRPPVIQKVFRRSRFEIAHVQGPYDGFTRGETWNGWAVPYFEKEVALQIAEDYNRVSKDLGGNVAGAFAQYDEEEDAFLFYDSVNEGEVYYSACIIFLRGREVTTYPIGTREWTWEEAA